jgi:23S rRNA pseudouridine1911/1915/1917 synthase
VFEDADLLVVDKPAGLLTIATEAERERTLYAAVGRYLRDKRPSERVFIVHRLDRDASGLVVFAKHPAVKRGLQEQFAAHTAGRRYVAIVEGRYPRDEETLRSHLLETRARKSHSTPAGAGSQLAVTHVRVAARSARCTRLELRLETGRKHQIRVQLAERGHPIVGDRRYGATVRSGRLALHGVELSFVHPRTGQAMTFRSPLPSTFPRLG